MSKVWRICTRANGRTFVRSGIRLVRASDIRPFGRSFIGWFVFRAGADRGAGVAGRAGSEEIGFVLDFSSWSS
jgi:hypothetical protein